jgi:hypothetical protein
MPRSPLFQGFCSRIAKLPAAFGAIRRGGAAEKILLAGIGTGIEATDFRRQRGGPDGSQGLEIFEELGREGDLGERAVRVGLHLPFDVFFLNLETGGVDLRGRFRVEPDREGLPIDGRGRRLPAPQLVECLAHGKSRLGHGVKLTIEWIDEVAVALQGAGLLHSAGTGRIRIGKHEYLRGLAGMDWSPRLSRKGSNKLKHVSIIDVIARRRLVFSRGCVKQFTLAVGEAQGRRSNPGYRALRLSPI